MFTSSQKSKKKFNVKKNVRLQFCLNKKSLIYKLWRMVFLTTCISGIFYLDKIEVVHFFYRDTLFVTSIFTRLTKTGFFFKLLIQNFWLKAEMNLQWIGLQKKCNWNNFDLFSSILDLILSKKCLF